MRFLVKASFPVEAANEAALDGRLGAIIEEIVEDLKPEAVYFTDDGGERTALMFVEMTDSSEIPKMAEPWFLAFEAMVEIHPVMNLDDLKRAEPHIKDAVAKYG